MTNPKSAAFSADVEAIYQLLVAYSFDADTYPAESIIAGWLEQFGPVWVSHAVTEALYQGRYKLISVDHILQLWQRRGQPIRHFNREFESIILGQTLLLPTGYGDGVGPTGANVDAERAIAPSLAPPTVVDDPDANPSQSEQGAAPATLVEAEEANTSKDAAAIPQFHPISPELSTGWGQADVIQPFVPRRDESDLHERLRAVVQAGRQP